MNGFVEIEIKDGKVLLSIDSIQAVESIQSYSCNTCKIITSTGAAYTCKYGYNYVTKQIIEAINE